MRVYKVTIHYGQHEVYYVHADDVAAATTFAIARDDKIAAEVECSPDEHRRVTRVEEFCSSEQVIGPPVSFVKPKAA